MSFLTLTFAICIGVLAGTWLFNALGGLAYWFQNRFPAPCREKERLNKKPLILVSLTALLLSGILVYSVNFHQDGEESNKLAQINEAPKAVYVGEDPLKLLPPVEVMPPPAPAPRIVEVTPPPMLEPSAPAPVLKKAPVKRYAPRVIYIDGRKGYIRNISVLWEGGESFEDVDLRELPFASQLVPLPPRLHHKKR